MNNSGVENFVFTFNIPHQFELLHYLWELFVLDKEAINKTQMTKVNISDYYDSATENETESSHHVVENITVRQKKKTIYDIFRKFS